MTTSEATGPSSGIFATDDRPVFRIIIYSLSLAFSVLVASLETMRSAGNGFTMVVSWKTVLVFAAAASCFLACFRGIFLSPNRRYRGRLLAVVVGVGLISFLYPLRFVPNQKFGAILIGLAIALAVLTTVGFMLYTAGKFFESDGSDEAAQPPSASF